MKHIYNISIWFSLAIIHLSKLFHKKARLWVEGRKNIFHKLKQSTKNKKDIVWFHCASLGEFEQGKPLIEYYKKQHPNHKILLTFFSPSGFEVRKNYPIADWVFYLPADTKNNAKRFIRTIKPLKVIFIKYEFWFNYMSEIKKANIPFYIVSAIFRKQQVFFKYNWFASQLRNVTHFFVQNSSSKNLLESIGINNVTISGDSRFDTVKTCANNPEKFPLIFDFSQGLPTIIFGSTWPKDENLISKFIKQHSEYNYIIAPHELKNINSLKKQTGGLLYSKLKKETIGSSNTLIIDSIGMLSSIYQYGDITYIGGGFGKGIHNILEPIAYGVPVVFGPNYSRFQEAHDLIALKTAVSINNYSELVQAISYFDDYDSNISKNYIQENCGATEIIIKNID
tara:strand:- start:1239 stop:2426 length:1188 start_codon:yes stop_codon:yes gene_type:complete